MSTLAFRLLRDQGSVTGFLATLETRDPASLVAVHYAHIATSLRLSRPGRRRISFATLILCSTFWTKFEHFFLKIRNRNCVSLRSPL
jgi:hypothetical protein